tara:strand:+ start:244 stop:1686 length:1443 start_codon:yes stop_codon:yes gene_type:complete
MLGSIRKFSGTIYAKILLGIIIIPFIFWGMGKSLTGGSKNIIVVIDKEKYSIEQLGNFISRTADKKVKSTDIEEFLSLFIGEKIIEKEIKYFEIKLSDNSLGKLIKHQKDFKRDNKFSRTEYEKFLLENNITASNFEKILSNEEKKRHLLNFVSGGVSPPRFLVNISYDQVYQKRSIELINLNDTFKKKLNFSENQIKIYFENKKDNYTEIYKSIKLLELNPKKLVGNEEFSDIFFKKIDEIDDLIIAGEKLDSIIQKFNLDKSNSYTINKSGKDKNFNKNENIPENLVKKIFNMDETEKTILIENKNRYFVVEVIKTENIQMNIENELIRKEVLLDLSRKTKRKLIAEIIDKINKNNFNKFNFDKLSKDENVNIQKINLKNKNDNKILKKEIVNQIYIYPEKKIIVVSEIGFAENYLIYIDKIENAKIGADSNEYKKFLNLSKAKIISDLYNTYDNYIKERYEIDINYQALDIVKNYYN